MCSAQCGGAVDFAACAFAFAARSPRSDRVAATRDVRRSRVVSPRAHRRARIAMTAPSALTRFRTEYGAHRAAEGRAHSDAELLALPYLRSGPLAKQWSVRACTFDAFIR